jgi:hypothetical protein
MDWLKEFAKDDFGKAVVTVCGTLLVTAFGAFLGGWKDIFLDWWRRRRTVLYQAMLLSTTLEQLITDCMDNALDKGEPDGEGMLHATSPHPTLEWPKELDWTAIRTDIMHRCLLLPAELKSAREAVGFVSEHISGPPDFEETFDEAAIRYSEVGLSAVHILNRLRDDYGVPLQDRYRDPFETFNTTIREIQERQRKNDEQQATWHAEIAERIAADAKLAKEHPEMTTIERLMTPEIDKSRKV